MKSKLKYQLTAVLSFGVSLLPLVSNADWIYEAGVITDENGITCNVSLSGENKLTIKAGGTTLPDGVTILDFTKPITSTDGQTQYDLIATAYECWENNTVITKVLFPETLTTIDSYTFCNCSALTEVVLPRTSLTSIGNYAFAGSTSLTTITPFFPDSVTYFGEKVCSGCTTLAGDLKILSESPVTFNSVGDTFYRCYAITSVTLGKGVTSLPYYFVQYANSITNVVLPDTLVSIGERAFQGCSALVNVTPFLPDTLTHLGSCAFLSCPKLEGDLKIHSENAVTIGEEGTYGTFEGSLKINSVSFGAGVTRIPNYFAYGCTSITNLEFKGAVHTIGKKAFYNCQNLVSVNPFLPDTVTNLGAGVFHGCANITSALEIASSDPVSVGYDGEYGAFCNCKKIPSAKLGDGVTYIQSRFLQNAHALTNLIMTGELTSIGSYAFYANNALKEVVLPGNSLVTIGSHAFRGMSSLANITPFLPNTVTNLGEAVFTGNSALKIDGKIASQAPVSLGGSNNNGIFCGGCAVTSMLFGPGVKTIPYSCFDGNSSVSNVVIQSDEIHFGTYAFYNSSAMREIHFAKGVPTWANSGGGLTAFQTRFIVPSCSAWNEFCADATKVQPASAFTEAELTSYYNKFGANAKKPAGYTLTYPVKQWIVFRNAGTTILLR